MKKEGLKNKFRTINDQEKPLIPKNLDEIKRILIFRMA
jgi:hypothetical protein